MILDDGSNWNRHLYQRGGNRVNFREEILSLTKELISFPSVNGTAGEREMAERIACYFRKIPYFQEVRSMCMS